MTRQQILVPGQLCRRRRRKLDQTTEHRRNQNDRKSDPLHDEALIIVVPLATLVGIPEHRVGRPEAATPLSPSDARPSCSPTD